MTTQAGYFASLHRPITSEELRKAKAEEISPGLWRFPDRSVGKSLNQSRPVLKEGVMVDAIYFDEVDEADIKA